MASVHAATVAIPEYRTQCDDKETVMLLVSTPTHHFYVAPQLGPYRLQHYLQQRGVDCDLLDVQLEDIDDFVRAHPKQYRVIGISGAHIEMPACLEVIAKLKKAYPEACCIVGGTSSTHNPALWLSLGFDAVILGYGEEPLYEFWKYYTTGLPAKEALQGIAYLRQGQCVVQPSKVLTREHFREVTYDNCLSMRIPYERYWEKNIADNIADNDDFIVRTVRVFTSTQCPNRCGYCSSKFLAQAQAEKHRICALSGEEILNLVKDACKKYTPESVFLNDDEFLFERERAADFCRQVITAKDAEVIPQDLLFECQSRSIDFFSKDSLDLKFITLLREAGFRRISIGAENFSKRLLSVPMMNKAWQSFDQVLALVDAFDRVGILLQVNMMLFVPETTREELIENIRKVYAFVENDNPVNLNSYIFADPGAPVFGKSEYPVRFVDLVSPINGYPYRFAKFYQLLDPALESQLCDVVQLFKREEGIFFEQVGWDSRSLAKNYTTPLVCMGILKAIGENELYKKFSSLIQKMATQKM